MSRRRLAALAAASLVVASCTSATAVDSDLAAAAAAAQPGATLRLAPGTYEGPVVIDKPLRIEGAGATLIGTDGEPALTIRDTDGVAIIGLSIAGGEPGVFLRRATDVSLESIDISDTLLHGIFAHDAEMHVSGCTISGLRGTRPQGIEIINSDALPTSTVTGCVVRGPMYEGIVSHVSRVSFSDNEVVGAERRGISVTEMSVGEMAGNRVSDGSGTGLFCGDMSLCTITDNAVNAIGPVADGPNSALGHGLVVHYQSAAYIQNFSTADVAGDPFRLMLGSALVPEPFDPDDRTHQVAESQR